MKQLTILFLLFCSVCYSQVIEITPVTTSSSPGSMIQIGRARTVSVNYNDSADAYFARLTTQPSSTMKALISLTIDSFQYYDIWDSAFVFYFHGAATEEAALRSWKGNYVTTKSGAIYFLPYYGFQSDGKSSYLNMNFIPRTAGMIGKSISFVNYVLTQSNYPGGTTSATRQTPMGCFTDSYLTNGVLAYDVGYDYRLHSMFINNASSNNVNLDKGSSRAIISNTRQNSNLYTYVNKTKTVNAVQAPVSLTQTINVWEFGYNYNGTLMNPPDYMIGFTLIGRYLTETQVDKLNDIVKYYYNNIPLPTTVYDTLGLQYKVALAGRRVFPFIRYQRESVKFMSYIDTLFLSFDNGTTWPKKHQFDDAERITMSYVYPNNALVFATNKNKIYYSKDSLVTITESTVKKADGDAYVFHTPGNALYPGDYFQSSTQIGDAIQGDTAILCFSNYGNFLNGANPTIIWASVDTGKTITAVYTFGTDSSFRDNSTCTGGSASGTYLGDPLNSIRCRHAHFTRFCSSENSFYVGTGDANTFEQMWMKGTCIAKTNTWTWSQYVTGATALRFKSGDAQFIGDTVIFPSDNAGDGGIFKCKISELATTAKHKKVYTTNSSLGSININNSGYGICGIYGAKNKILTTANWGTTWTLKTLNHINVLSSSTQNASIGHTLMSDTDGWFVIYPSIDPSPYSDQQAFYFKIK